MESPWCNMCVIGWQRVQSTDALELEVRTSDSVVKNVQHTRTVAIKLVELCNSRSSVVQWLELLLPVCRHLLSPPDLLHLNTKVKVVGVLVIVMWPCVCEMYQGEKMQMTTQRVWYSVYEEGLTDHTCNSIHTHAHTHTYTHTRTHTHTHTHTHTRTHTHTHTRAHTHAHTHTHTHTHTHVHTSG